MPGLVLIHGPYQVQVKFAGNLFRLVWALSMFTGTSLEFTSFNNS